MEPAKGIAMRLLYILCESGVEDHIIGDLMELGVTGFSRFTGVSGMGAHGRREGTPVWPGMNTMLLACVPDDLSTAVIERLAALRDDRKGRVALSVFSTAAEELL